jgi:hypothetical protein
MFMANDYTDSFAGEPYFIKKGEQLSAAGMTVALNTKEKVANKTDTLSSSSIEYPSCKAVSDNLAGVKLPVGTILMYDGYSWADNVTMPGWYICDGRGTPYGNTPNLQDKFIKGKGSKADNGNGQMTLGVQHLPAHKHSITDKEHDHATSKIGCADGTIPTFPSGPYFMYGSDLENGEWITTPNVNKNYTGITSTNDSTGGGQAFDVLPSYYSVIYIKKMV